MWNKKPDKRFEKKLKRPPYWRVVQLLRQLRLKHKEREKGGSNFHITVDDFGMVFRFNARQPMTNYEGWDIIDVDLKNYAAKEIQFGQEVMWYLIAKGYMAYLRGEKGNSQMFRTLLIEKGWAQRIIDKRLELYNNEPKHKFMIEQTKRLQKMPTHYVVMHYPSFFDYLW